MLNGRVVRLGVSIGVGVLALVAFLVYASPDRLAENLSTVSYGWLLAYVACIPLVYVLRAVRWRVLLRASGPSVPLSHAFWTTMVGFTANAVVPTRVGGEVVRAYIIDEKDRLGFSKALSSIAVERVLDVALIVGLALTGVLALPATVSLPASFLQAIMVVMAVLGAVLLLLVIGISKSARSLAWISGTVAKVPWLRSAWKLRITQFIQAFVEGNLAVGRNPPILVRSLLLTVGLWLTIFISTFMLFLAFGLVVPVAVILVGSMLFQLSFLLPAPIGYVGTYQIYWTSIFGALTSADLGALAGIAIVAQLIGFSVLFPLGLGGIVSLRLPFSRLFRLGSRPGVRA